MKMELLDRYLQAVRKRLPWQRQDDIIAELRANLETQLDEKQAEAGRPLTPAEAEEWIRSLGSPVQMAAHYQPQQYLIGPGLYPMYLHVLRLASVWSIVIFLIVNTISIMLSSSAGGERIAEVGLGLPSILIQVAAWVTAAFAAFEFFAVRYPDKCPPIAGLCAKWSPRDLPPLESHAQGKKKRTYAQAVAEIVFGFIFLAWLVVVPRHPFLMLGPGAALLHGSPFRLAPEWWTFYWWLVGLNAFELAWKCMDLLRESWGGTDRARHIVMKFFGLVPVVVVATLPGHMYVLLRNPDADAGRYAQTLDSINHGIHTGALVVCVIIALQLAVEIGRAFLDPARERSVVS